MNLLAEELSATRPPVRTQFLRAGLSFFLLWMRRKAKTFVYSGRVYFRRGEMATSKTGDKKLLGIIGEEVRFEASQAAELISAIGAEGAAVTVGLLLAGELKRFVDVLSEFDHQIVAGIRKGLYGEGAKAASSLGDDDRGLGGLEVAMNGVSSSIDKLASRFTEGHNRVDCDDENDEDGEDEEDGEGQVL